MDIKQIKALRKQYLDAADGFYSKTREQQKKDQTYIDDSFVPNIRHPHKILRLGIGDEIVNSPAEHIVTSNPQAFVEGKNKEACIRISTVVNDWIDTLRRQNPNPFKESVKNKLGRGENYIEVLHNEGWVTGDKKRIGMPVLFIVHDPMVIYGSRAENDDGIPDMVIVFYERQPEDVIVRYPNWTKPKDVSKRIEWFEYHDATSRYFEADGEPVLKGNIQKNLYGFSPFVRKYSGFGKRSPDGEFANLIVSDIRNSRGLIEEICLMRSDIMSVLHLSAHKAKTIFAAGEVNEENIRQNLTFGTEDLNILQKLGDLSQFKIDDVTIEQPTIQAFTHLNDITGELIRRHPFITAGFPWGTSGRQQGMTDVAAMRRYDTVIENTENEWATALEMALKICKTVPLILPLEGLHTGDLDTDYKVIVNLKAKDPIEEDRLITLGDRLRRQPNPAIDLETFHTEFMGMTQEKSKKTTAKILADLVTIYNPDWAEVAGMVSAEETGMREWLEKVSQRRQMLEKQQQGLQQAAPPTTREREQGEVETEAGQEMGTVGTTGGRRPPIRYERGA